MNLHFQPEIEMVVRSVMFVNYEAAFHWKSAQNGQSGKFIGKKL
jgi:hypothetical protein